MGAAENRAKSSAYAAYMKAHGIQRRSGQCPWGCGASYSAGPNGSGASLMEHLTRCRGGGGRRFAPYRRQRAAA